MAGISRQKRIWGWMLFDWAQQPYATLGLTFIFSPYFAAVAADLLIAEGLSEGAAKAEAQTLWSASQTVAGLFIAFTAPFLGAWADSTGRKMPWIHACTAIAVGGSAMLWWLQPDGTGLMLALVAFWVGYVGSETAFNLNNALLPSLGTPAEVGRISGNATAFGYWGGVLALFLMLLFVAEDETTLKTLIGRDPIFGLDPAAREGTRFVGPFIALWFGLFIIPYLIWNRETPDPGRPRVAPGQVLRDLGASIRAVARRRSCSAFLLGSMFYRDALTGLYVYGGIYARQVLDWTIIQIGVFGIIAAIAAAVLSWVGGLADHRFGPKPVIRVCVWALILVSCVIVGLSREQAFGLPLPQGSMLSDIIFYLCGAIVGGAGGALYSASRSMMVRHADPARPTEAFGLFALTGKATAFLAPALITLATQATQDVQLGYTPLIVLFLLGLGLLHWVHPDGDRAA